MECFEPETSATPLARAWNNGFERNNLLLNLCILAQQLEGPMQSAAVLNVSKQTKAIGFSGKGKTDARVRLSHIFRIMLTLYIQQSVLPCEKLLKVRPNRK